MKAASNLTTDRDVTEPDRFLAREEAKVGVPAFVYEFSFLPSSLRGHAIGVGHGGEVGYVFELLPATDLHFGTTTIPAATPDDRKTAAAMHAYWVAFAKTGKPGSAGGPAWPSQLEAPDAVLDFANDGPTVRPDFEKARLDPLAAKADAAK